MTTQATEQTFHTYADQSLESQINAMGSRFDTLFAHLEPPASEMERAYRVQLLSAKNGYRMSRFQFGQVLHTYWFWCLDTRNDQPTAAQKTTFSGLCDLIGVERRTAYNIMEDYRRAKPVHPDFLAVAAMHNIDLAERRNSELVTLLVQHPDLPRTVDIQDRATAVFQKARETVAESRRSREKAAQVALAREAAKSRLDKLTRFLQDLYAGESVATFKTDMESAVKALTFYVRGDNRLATEEDLKNERRKQDQANS
ncbi:hypothetical protein [Terriglobus roseus]|nr:hypothetical protein [Terriglobus roseus]